MKELNKVDLLYRFPKKNLTNFQAIWNHPDLTPKEWCNVINAEKSQIHGGTSIHLYKRLGGVGWDAIKKDSLGWCYEEELVNLLPDFIKL